ncbi:23645_t:CDS:10 [Gigaspora margarita]|uniref:23645_t:CDS:1 n=1 Tax=Gigaspora margarita TaxID=4874 RepID=A0ABN7UL19_GIGMA|nr:23645_t:CDS:10 [Gigaspora margarita]
MLTQTTQIHNLTLGGRRERRRGTQLEADEIISSHLDAIYTSQYIYFFCNIPRLIKLGKANSEIVAKIKYRLEFEEYPETSEDGVACVYNVTGMDPEKALEIFDLKNIQYLYKEGTTRESVYCPFLNTKVYKETRTCRSIKMCQFAAPELLKMTHTFVNFEDNLFKKIFDANELSLDTNTLKLFQEHVYYNDGITEEISSSVQHCYLVHPFSARARKCLAQGLIQKNQGCPVKFWHYVPENLEECPYIIIMSRFTHNHPPPPPSKIPVAIQNDLKNIIAEENILDLTATCRRLITCTSMQKFLKGAPLPELHPSLNNRSKIDHMIATKRRFFDNGQYLILCGHKNQTKYLADSLYFEIDMSFKHVHGPINEREVCGYIERYQKTLVFACAFTILQTAYIYKKLFEELFICVEQDCGHPIEFQHIHGHGIGCILVDEHQGQALVMSTLEFLQQCEEPGVADWVQNKRQSWVLASLSPAFTKMSPTVWANTPFTTNAGESAHSNINRSGHQEEILRIEHKKLSIPREKNNELEREIML